MSTLRTITGFKSRLAGGGARPNLFEVSIPTFPVAAGSGSWTAENASTFSFLCKAAALPSSTINPVDIPFRGRTLKVAGDRTINSWTVTIINDEDFSLHTAFMKWSNAINKLNNATGATNPSSYMTNAYVYQLGRGANAGKNSTTNFAGSAAGNESTQRLRSFKFYDIWPSDVAEIPLSYDSTDQIEEYTVEFQVQWYSIGEDGDISNNIIV